MAGDRTGPDANEGVITNQMMAVAERVRLKPGMRLTCHDKIYFPLDGVATLSLARESSQFQIGFATRGDAIGLQSLFVPDFPALNARVLRGGSFICVSPEALRRLMGEDRLLRDRLIATAMLAMSRYLAEATGAFALTLERRVARWIGACRHVFESDALPVTHQEIASSLGVRRSGVTVALHMLEGRHLIRSKRARIEVRDTDGLSDFAAGDAATALPAAGEAGRSPSSASAAARIGPAPVRAVGGR